MAKRLCRTAKEFFVNVINLRLNIKMFRDYILRKLSVND